MMTYDQISTCTDIDTLIRLRNTLRGKLFCKRGAELTHAQTKHDMVCTRILALKARAKSN